MYTYEQRITAVKLYIKYCQKIAPVIRELGYPNRHVLSSGSKNMKLPEIYIKKAGTAKSLNFPKNRSKQRYSFIRNMATTLL